jgi:hypothetical protein
MNTNKYSYTHTLLPVKDDGVIRMADSKADDLPNTKRNLPWAEYAKLTEAGTLSDSDVTSYYDCYIYSKSIRLEKPVTSNDINSEFLLNHFITYSDRISDDLFKVPLQALDIGNGAIEVTVANKLAKVYMLIETEMFDKPIIIILVEDLPHLSPERCSKQIKQSLEDYYYYFPLHGKSYDEFNSLSRWDAKKEFERVEKIKPQRIEKIKQILRESNVAYVPLQDYSEIDAWVKENIYSIAYRNTDTVEAHLVPDAAWLSLLFDIGLLIEQDFMNAYPQLKPYLSISDKNSKEYHHRVLGGFSFNSSGNSSVDLPNGCILELGFNFLSGRFNNQSLDEMVAFIKGQL